MSSMKKKPFKFNKTVVVKGNKTSIPAMENWTEEKINEDVVQEFTAGTVVDATYIGGRGGNAISFEVMGGILPNGEQYNEAVSYTMPTDAQYNPIDQDIPMPKVVEVIENVAKEDEVVEDSKLSPLVMTAIVGGVLILGYLGYKHFTKAK
jgi:hypothetical protein